MKTSITEAKIWPLNDLIASIDILVIDTGYKAGKNIKDPKAKRAAQKHFEWAVSMQHYLNQLKAKEQ